MQGELGLRERKKLRTRQLIAETARRLFSERGFDVVPVSEVAREAEVSEATVFNYFPTKEDLVYYGMEAFEAEMLEAVRGRPADEAVVDSFARFVLAPRGLLAADDDAAAEHLAKVARMIATSAALRSRQREIFARFSSALADLIAEQSDCQEGDLRPLVAAHALMGVHESLIGLVHRRLLEGATDRAELAKEVKARGRQAIELLRKGLADYGARQSSNGANKVGRRTRSER